MDDQNGFIELTPRDLAEARARSSFRGLELEGTAWWWTLEAGEFLELHESAKRLVAWADDVMGATEELFLNAMREPQTN